MKLIAAPPNWLTWLWPARLGCTPAVAAATLLLQTPGCLSRPSPSPSQTSPKYLLQATFTQAASEPGPGCSGSEPLLPAKHERFPEHRWRLPAQQQLLVAAAAAVHQVPAGKPAGVEVGAWRVFGCSGVGACPPGLWNSVLSSKSSSWQPRGALGGWGRFVAAGSMAVGEGD